MKRRELLLVAFSWPALSLPALGAQAAPPPSEAEALYREATSLLLRGRDFERAAKLLAEAEKKEPDDYRFPAARGCALVGRAASVAYAAAFNKVWQVLRAEYPKELAEWKAAQKNPESELYGEPKPQPPPRRTFPTKDDRQPFRLSEEAAKKRLEELVTAGRAAFALAEERATTGEEKADAAYLHGWGLSLLLLYGSGIVSWRFPFENIPKDSVEGNAAGEEAAAEEEEQEEKPLFPLPTFKEVQSVFARGLEAAPESGVLWRALGDHEANAKKRQEIHEKAARFLPRDAPLWYLLYSEEAKKGFGEAEEGEERADRDKALVYLRGAQKADPSNGWLSYEEAGLHFRRTRHSVILFPAGAETAEHHKEARQRYHSTLGEEEAREAGAEAIAAVERGNLAPRSFQPVYEPSVPKLLVTPWRYADARKTDYDFSASARFRELARSLSGYALFAAEEGKRAEALRACRAAVGLGERLEGNWAVGDNAPGGRRLIDVLVGHAVVAVGLKMRVTVEEIAGTPEGAEAAQREYNVFRERVKAHTAIVNQEINKELRNPMEMYKY